MAKAAAVIRGAQVQDVGRAIVVVYECSVDGDAAGQFNFSGEVTVDFATTTGQITSAIRQRVRADIIDVTTVTVPLNRILIFGGPV